jgi:hypothetical protein
MTPYEQELVGKYFIFEDGNKIEVIQIKQRDSEMDGLVPWVTYHITQGRGLPQKHVIIMKEFISLYGHLFGLED